MNRGEKLLLDRGKAGLAKLRQVEGIYVVCMFHIHKRAWKEKATRLNQGRMCLSVNNTTVYLNRAIWLLHNLEEIPVGAKVDHINQDKLDDRPDNLQLHTTLESAKQGHQIQQDKTLKELCDWFDVQGWLCT